MNQDDGKQAMMSVHKEKSNGDTQHLSSVDIEPEVFSEVSLASNGVLLRRRFGQNGAADENQLEDSELRRIGIEEGEGLEDNSAENLGPLRSFPVGEVRVLSRNRNSSDVEYVDDDGASSVCSENVGDFLSLPCDAASRCSTLERNTKLRRRERESLLESLEKQRRESVESRLKELRIPNKRHSLSTTLSTSSEMPIIAKSNPMKNATLPRQMRRPSYQSVIVDPFFAKSGSSGTRPLLLGLGGQEMRERRGSLVRTPIASATETTDSFPLRAAGSLSNIENFVVPAKHHSVSARPMRALPSETKMRKSEDRVEPKEILNSSLSKRIQAFISDQRSGSSLENGCRNNYSAKGLKEIPDPWHNSLFNGNKQIRNPDRPDFAENSCDASESEKESSSSKTDSPEVFRKVYSAPETLLLPARNVHPSAIETMKATESDERFRDVSAADKLLNGTYPLKTEYSSDKASDTSYTGNDDKHCDKKNSVTLSSQTPTSIETCREDKTTRGGPDVCHQTTHPQKAVLLDDHQTDREPKNRTNARFDLDNTWSEDAPNADSANGNQVSTYPAVAAKYCSDIQIQIKEVEPVFPASFGHSTCNGENRGDWRREPVPPSVDDDLEIVAPNWSSYPGPLPDGSRSNDPDESHTTSIPVDDGSIVIDTPDRSISTLEINLQPLSVHEREKASKKILQTDNYDSAFDLNESKVFPVLSSRADANVDNRSSSSGFNSRRKRITVENVESVVDVFNTPQNSVERKEMFVKQDTSPATPRTITLPRDHLSRNQIESQTRGGLSATASQRDPVRYSPRQDLHDGVSLPGDDLSVEVTPSKANVTRITFYSKKDEQRTRSRDGERTRSSFEAVGGVSTPNDRWQASVAKREDRWKDSRMTSETSRSPEKTPSVERIWETLEQPRTRLTKRNLRPESDTEKSPQSLQSSRLAFNGGSFGETNKAEAVLRSISLQDHHVAEGDPAEESLLEIEVLKGGLGLGFCIEGGKDGPYGDRPITVKRLFRGSSDSKFSIGTKNSLRAGDEILTANGRDMTLLSRFVAWNFLKTLPEGTIRLLVRRRTQQQPADAKQLQ